MTIIAFVITGLIFLVLSIFIYGVWSYYVPASLVLLSFWIKLIQPLWMRQVNTLKTTFFKMEPSAAAGWTSIISGCYGIISLIMSNWIQFFICLGVFILSLTMKFSHAYAVKKKSAVTTEEFAEKLLKLNMDISKNFFLEFKEYLKEDEISVNKEDVLLHTEIVIMSLWTIFKAFESDDKKNEKFLSILFEKHIEESKEPFETREEKIEAMKYARSFIVDRLKTYFEAWDNKSGGQQMIVSLKMLECMGIPNEDLLNYSLKTYVNMWILKSIESVLHFRLNFEIVDL